MGKEYKAGYEYLLAYKITVPIYDLTVEFCHCCSFTLRSLGEGGPPPPSSPPTSSFPSLSSKRTEDQMIQAARSGMQNIPEGFKQQSLSSYIKLAGVARGSEEELLNDYLSYARQHGIPIWPKERVRREIRESREIWEILTKTPTLPSSPSFPSLPKDPEQAVNLLVDLLKQAGYLQDRLIASLKEKHTKEGGFSENLFRARLKARQEACTACPPTGKLWREKKIGVQGNGGKEG